MLPHVANSIDATNGSGTRIHALVIDARQGVAAVRVDVTLWSASRLRIAEVSRQTGANSAVVLQLAFAIPSTWTWHAGVLLGMIQSIAANSWVAGQASIARAHRVVFFDTATGSTAAGSGTRIVASEAHAGLAVWTIGIYLALIAMAADERSRISGKSVGADAGSLAIAIDHTVGIGSAGVRIADSAARFATALVGVSNISGSAVAFLAITGHITVGIAATGTGLTQFNRNSGLFAQPEWIADLVVRTVADRLTR